MMNKTWEQICEIFTTATDIQTVTQRGDYNIWISIRRSGDELIVGPAVSHEPSSMMARRSITQKEYVELYPCYKPWREGTVTRAQITEISKKSTYIFALIHFLNAHEHETESAHEMKCSDYSNYVVCKPSGYFLGAVGYDAYVISELLEYKLIPDKEHFCRTGFPYSSADKVSEILSNHRINHYFKSKDKDITKKEFDDNEYGKFTRGFQSILGGDYVFPQKKDSPYEKEILDYDADAINLWSKFVVRDCKTDELFAKTILPSYELLEIKKRGGAYYGAKYKSKITSDANPVEGETISDEAPLTKLLMGHKAGDTIKHIRGNGEIDLYFVEEVENRGITYKAEKREIFLDEKPSCAEIDSIDESTQTEREKLTKEAIQYTNALIDVMLKLEINDEVSTQLKALIDLRQLLNR